MNKQLLDSIKTEVECTVDQACRSAIDHSFVNYITLLVLGDYCELFEGTDMCPYVINNLDDIRYDNDRMTFMMKYLQKHYGNPDFFYQDDEGWDCLTIEMMIYSQLWESDFFVKLLTRLAQLSIGNEYPWIIDFTKSKWNVIHYNIIDPLKERECPLGNLIGDCYESNLRNGFAHSLYYIDNKQQIINYYKLSHPSEKPHRLKYPDKYQSISFDDFQKKFIKSAHLSFYLSHVLKKQRNCLLEDTKFKEYIPLPNKKYLPIKVEQDDCGKFFCIGE